MHFASLPKWQLLVLLLTKDSMEEKNLQRRQHFVVLVLTQGTGYACTRLLTRSISA